MHLHIYRRPHNRTPSRPILQQHMSRRVIRPPTRLHAVFLPFAPTKQCTPFQEVAVTFLPSHAAPSSAVDVFVPQSQLAQMALVPDQVQEPAPSSPQVHAVFLFVDAGDSDAVANLTALDPTSNLGEAFLCRLPHQQREAISRVATETPPAVDRGPPSSRSARNSDNNVAQ